MLQTAQVGLATSKTPDVKESWVRHGYNCHNFTTKTDNCGKSAATLAIWAVESLF
jgi:hypothetical protein